VCSRKGKENVLVQEQSIIWGSSPKLLFLPSRAELKLLRANFANRVSLAQLVPYPAMRDGVASEQPNSGVVVHKKHSCAK